MFERRQAVFGAGVLDLHEQAVRPQKMPGKRGSVYVSGFIVFPREFFIQEFCLLIPGFVALYAGAEYVERGFAVFFEVMADPVIIDHAREILVFTHAAHDHKVFMD